jgi:hypothetical protein
MCLSINVRNASGTSLLELTIALFMASVVIAGAYQVYRFVTVSSLREQQKAELQRDIINVSNSIERDIRVAGCGLPGNGVSTNLIDSVNYRLTCYSNETGRRTTLSKIAGSSDTKVIVADGAGFSADGCVCLAGHLLDTLYREIARIGMQGGGFDTLYLSSAIGSCGFPIGSPAYPATKVTYMVNAGPPLQIERYKNSLPIAIGSKLDSIIVILKNSAGNPVGAAVENATMVTVVLGGHVGTGGNRVFLADSTEVNIRNVN